MDNLKKALLIFLTVNLCLYLFMWQFHWLVPFNQNLYINSSHHYLTDERILSGNYNFLRALGQYDAQWYLKIADNGYPPNPQTVEMENKTVMDGLTYAFFPLYPLLISILNMGINNVELAAFILGQILATAAFCSLYFVVSRIYGEKIAFRTSLLLFLFPFSIFFRSYYTESLFLMILVWYGYFLVKKQWWGVAVANALMMVTRPTGLFLVPVTTVFLIADCLKNKTKLKEMIIVPLITGLPFISWMIFNFKSTGDPFYWKNVQSSWYLTSSPLVIIKVNLYLLKNFFALPFHSFHTSRVDILAVMYVGFILIAGFRFLKREWWLMSLMMWLPLLILKDTMSFSRYQSVSFPLFVYLAGNMNNKWFTAVSVILGALLFATSLYFINWHWIG
ncbi:MAG: hypothetical protein UV73_C0006G0018 [Candidatus Gottesmanbacteria bacterium GW2011_GWA2_43_14]|uniref:Glycosyltransferase RgtA/B/C/D-like domain-containing protein n=1 Tax=Candidatus Gottesmanbacteria bacterium GW2011_GWA2_43_14 TaxID=1618443 RepID=A0A0G1DJ20_9BACT|nr:MAG: hypothetical protein UV73_C0006G0018 [Candidatus Gottesmanbacteria bacterium GW2011_GWA2_43_14]